MPNSETTPDWRNDPLEDTPPVRGAFPPKRTQTTRIPLTRADLDRHLSQRIMERLNLGHLYRIEEGEEGLEAVCRPRAAVSVWRVVQDAVEEAGWRITPR